MKTLFRVLGAAAAVAATGAAIVVMDKVLNDKGSLHVEEVEFPEKAENDPDEAAKTAETYTKAAEPGSSWPPVASEKAEEPAAPEETAEPAAEETAPAEEPAYDPEAPNANPVEAAPAVAPKDENGKFDTTKIADVNDFGDWEEQGCKG